MSEPHSRPRALIVEDEILTALDLENAIASLGYDVCPLAPSERSARAIAMQEEPELALVDVCLDGGLGGIETARWLREVCGASIVFITAWDDEATIERIHERVPGAPVLAKPTYRERLAEAIRACHIATVTVWRRYR